MTLIAKVKCLNWVNIIFSNYSITDCFVDAEAHWSDKLVAPLTINYRSIDVRQPTQEQRAAAEDDQGYLCPSSPEHSEIFQTTA